MTPDDRDPTVKELLEGKPLDEVVDEATAREFERWFGLPSFAEVDAAPPAPEDPEVTAMLERRARTAAAVDPGLLAAIAARSHPEPERLLQFSPDVTLRVDPELPLFDFAAADRGHAIAEPREVEISEELRDDLRECTPQALLRDLHRPELGFDKQFEMIDHGQELKFDITAEVESAMSTSWKLPPLNVRPFHEGRALVAELRALRNRPWPELYREARLVNRRIVE